MSQTAKDFTFDEESFENNINDSFDASIDKLSDKLSIVVSGRVSSGKSSFLNALLQAAKDEPYFEVAAQSGVTVDILEKKIGNVIFYDTPGLHDVKEKNSEVAEAFLKDEHDLGILVLSGSADSSQLENYQFLKKNASHVFIVLNKSDMFSKDNLEKIIQQWRTALNLDSVIKIYQCSSRGYDTLDRIVDPETGEEREISCDELGIPKTIRGFKTLRSELIDKLGEVSKDKQFVALLKNKNEYVYKVIGGAAVASAAAAFVPGSALTITGIQVAAITDIIYTHTGQAPTKAAVFALLPAVATRTAGQSLFLWAKSFLPPTGVLDVAAAGIAVSLTVSMLLAVHKLAQQSDQLDDMGLFKEIFDGIFAELKDHLKNVKDKRMLLSPEFWLDLVTKL